MADRRSSRWRGFVAAPSRMTCFFLGGTVFSLLTLLVEAR